MPSLAEICSKLKSEGWRISEQSVLKGLEDEDKTLSTYQEVRNILLNTDLKDVVDNRIIDDTSTSSKKASSVSGPLVLQVCKVRNICTPKAAEGGEGGGGGRLMRLTLTDGNSPYHAIEFTPCPAISSSTAPGSKVLLTGRIPQAGGFMLLSPKMISILGGKVDALYEKWVLTESVLSFSTRQACINSDGVRPPPWIPFNKAGAKGVDANGQTALKGFKSLKDGEDSTSAAEDRFAEQRKQAVQELVKGKQGAKVFGGGKQMPDAAVARVVGAGFSADVAQWALSNNAGDANAAIRELRAAASGQPIPSVVRRDSSTSGGGGGGRDRGGGRGGRGGGRRGRGRGGGGPDDSDDDFEAMRDAPRPSGPASLFDFFDAKLAERKETIQFVEPIADVRGSVYDRARQPETTRDMGRGGRRARGRGVGSSFTRETVRRRASTPPPDMTSAQEWPAPGEEHPAKTRGSDTTTTYIQSQSRLEERAEEQLELERMAREEKMRMAKERSGEVAPRSVGARGGGGSSSNSYDGAGSSRGSYRGGSSGSSYRGGSATSYHDSNSGARGYRGGGRYNNNNSSNYRGSNSGYSDSRGGGSFGDGATSNTVRENSSNATSFQGRGSASNYRDGSRGSSRNYNSSRDDTSRSTNTTTDTSDSSPQKGGGIDDSDTNSVGFDGGSGDGGYSRGRGYGGPRGGGYRGRSSDNRGSRGGYDGYRGGGNDSTNAGGYNNYKGGGYDNNYRGGGYDNSYRGGGSYNNNNNNYRGGGYDNSYRGGGYSNSYRGGYDNSSRGGYDSSSRGGYDNSSRGGYDNSSRGGYDSSSRGGYDSSSRGGYDSSSGRGNHNDRQGGYSNGSYDASSSGHDTSRGGYSSRGGSSEERGGGGYHRGRGQQRGYGGFYTPSRAENSSEGRGGGGNSKHSDSATFEQQAQNNYGSDPYRAERGGGGGGAAQGSSSSYTKGQEALIEQFKKSIALQGYTGYDEFQDQQGGGPARASFDTVEFRRGGDGPRRLRGSGNYSSQR